MDALLLIARLGLAAVFVLAGVGKLLDLKGSQKAVRDFGVPAQFSGILGLALPVVELAVAIALLSVDTARYGALVGFLLLGAFIAGIVWNLRQGKTPDCHCFGQIHSEPAGPRTLIRNAALAIVALFILIVGWNDPGYEIVGWAGDLSGVEWTLLAISLLLLVGIAVLGWVVLHMLGQNGRLLLRFDEMERQLAAVSAGGTYEAAAAAPKQNGLPKQGLPIGTSAPDFRLKGIHGETMSLDALLAADKPLLLVFTDPTCGPCAALMPDVAKWQQEHSDKFLTAIISRGTVAANQEKARPLGLGMMLLQQNREIAEAYKSGGTPSAVVIGADGKIATEMVGGTENVRTLVQGLLNPSAPRPNGRSIGAGADPAPAAKAQQRSEPTPQVGAIAPDVTLKDLDGAAVQLADLFERDSVLIFWSPTCGFCQRMANDIIAWEKNAPAEAPQAIIITSGDIEANRKFEFASIVLHDPTSETMRHYGTTGTPSAIAVDSDGKVSSELRIGQPGVMSLLKNEPMPQAQAAPKAVAIGEPAPEVSLPDLKGKGFELAEMQGKEVALIFWNPGCGFCNRMVDDLKGWEENRPEGAPELVLVSTGTIESNAAHGFDSRVVIDQGFKVGRSFGASGTPSAVLIDAEGNVASRVAVGAPGVFELLGSPKVAQAS